MPFVPTSGPSPSNSRQQYPDAAMASLSDDELEYLSPSFNPSSLTVPRLRAILVSHDISYPSSAKKSELIEIFTQELVPRSRRILAARSRIKRSSRGITNMPSSQEGTVVDDEDDDSTSMPPPIIPPTSRPKSRKSVRKENTPTVGEDDVAASSRNGTPSGGKQRPNKHARPSDTDTDLDTPRQPSTRKTRRSEATPAIISRPPEDVSARPPTDQSVFSHDNPFQSGSSPLGRSDSRRRSAGASNERRKSSSARRRTEGAVRTGTPSIKQEDGIVVPSVKTFEVPLKRFSKPKREAKEDQVKAEEDEVLAGEEFTPEEQLELVRARAANGERDILPPRKPKRTRNPSVLPTSAPWVIILTLFMGYALWWRQEKLQAGYCGIGRPSDALSNMQIPEWAAILVPQCEPCPQHAICYENLKTACDQDFVLKPHPLSLGGLVPLPPTCEPDGEKARRVKVVADRAIENLRDRRADWECGTLVDEEGKPAPAVELDEASLKKAVAKKRRRGMSDREFEDLWKSALGELDGRDEVVSTRNEHSSHLLTSTSLARLPLGCAFRRSVRVTLARYRVQLGVLSLLVSLVAYVRSEVIARQAAKARVPALVATTLDRLATQAGLHNRGDAAEPWISVGQLRDDVLRDEFSAARREDIWKKVKAVVELNANVRASVREGRGGDVSRVWEWIGSLSLLGGEDHQLQQHTWSSGPRRSTARVSWAGAEAGSRSGSGPLEAGSGSGSGRESPPQRSREMLDIRKWDEGRPIY